MTTPDNPVPQLAAVERATVECVALVARQFGRDLDWSLASLKDLDMVCGSLLEDGPLTGQHLSLWQELVGAYTGEVLARAYDGQWTVGEYGVPVLSALGITAHPFSTAGKILRGDPNKSLAAVGRALPVIAEQSRAAASGEPPAPAG